MSRGNFFSETVSKEVLLKTQKSVLRLRYLVTVPPLFGPGFHFIGQMISGFISLVAMKPDQL